MNYCIIAIGDELLIGQVTDTNSGWIARHLTPFGWNVQNIKLVADNASQIKQAIIEAFAMADCIIMTGGLGPTKDDITKATLCEYFGCTLVHDTETAQNVADIVARLGLKMNQYTATQAMVPSVCQVIQNEVGTAPIMWFEKDGKILVSLPGVPFEMETMMQRRVIPMLTSHIPSATTTLHKTFIVVGYPESNLAMKLADFEQSLPSHIHLAYLPQPSLFVRLRLTGILNDKNLLESQFRELTESLRSILGEAVLCEQDLAVEAILGELLKKKGLTVSTAESCTGGNVAHLITQVAGSSQYFTGAVVSYDNSVKRKLLGVPQAILDEFGAVSRETVEQMAVGAAQLLGTDCAIATSGIAGPSGGTPEKPVGTVWMAAKCGDKLVTERKLFFGDRNRVIERASFHAILMLIRLLVSF